MSRGLVIVIMGVSGSGKTTVGRALARAIDGLFHDADDFHSQDSIEKMRRGSPLTDADREPWLMALRQTVDGWLEEDGVIHVLACSALTRHARQRLGSDRDEVRLVYLHGPADLVASRMHGRDHFMSPELLASQLAALEPPDDALALDVSQSVDELVARIRSHWCL
jgi:gluconokinase